MLLEFRFCNFKAFRDETVFSLVASTDKTLQTANTMETGPTAPSRAVRTAAIYGPNAGGKTTLLAAMGAMQRIVVNSGRFRPDQGLGISPFRLDEESAGRPTMFEVTLMLNGVRHQYGYSCSATRIEAEWLHVYPQGRRQTWLDREFDAATGEERWEFSSHLTGAKRVWQQATRPNALFLSTAIQLNSDSLRPLFDWFGTALHIFLDGGHGTAANSISRLEDADRGGFIASMLRAADTGIGGVTIERLPGRPGETVIDMVPGEVKPLVRAGGESTPLFRHRAGDVTVQFNLSEESFGTQRLFALAGPLADILEKGSVLVIDELDRSLHPLLVRRIIEMFQDPGTNPKGAQLICTTHDTTLLDSTLLRRDQIWFVEKDAQQAATVVPLTDFSPRKSEALQRNYLSGRYGAIPILDRRLVPNGE